MLIRIGYELIFDLPGPVPMLLLLHTHPSRAFTMRRPEALLVDPQTPFETFTDWFGNTATRLLAPAGRLRLYNDAIVEDTGRHDDVGLDAPQVPVNDLPDDVVQFLLSSRYCEVDRLSDIAWNLFGRTPLGWPRVQAVSDWVHNHVEFGYGYARSTKTAYDVYEEKKGVCRDFTHLMITMLRALNIPARYATGYLGDIGVPISPLPMDFSAWLEVYLGHRWYTFDPRHNETRIGRVLMARGRDATDVALTTSFGPSNLEKFTVWTDEVTEEALAQTGR